MSGAAWRLLVEEADDGAANMAVDEAILEAYDGTGEARPPTLRLYGWRPAALSLGRHQDAKEACDPLALRREGIDLVRRPTGGTAVLHDTERTYAVVGAFGREPFAGGGVGAYRAIAGALARALRLLGADAVAIEPSPGDAVRNPSCFESLGAWEIAASGRKLVGSAQARRRRAFLQHGSIPLRLDPARLVRLTGREVDERRFTDLRHAAGRDVDPAEIDRAVVTAFEAALGAAFATGALTEAEALRAAELRCWKYDSMSWTREGRLGARETRWGPAIAR